MHRHDWIVDMLSDLLDYAVANSLPELADSVISALAVAQREISRADGPTSADPCPDRTPQVH
jgi:hypothetical protein